MAQLNWTYEEVVLAADLVARNDWKGLRATDPRVIELSALLQAATIHPAEGRPAAFRSPGSVQRKTFDIATQHPDYTGKPTKGGRNEALVIAEFLRRPEDMHAEAQRLRADLTAVETSQVPADPDTEVLAAWEGTARAGAHLRRERDPKLRAAKIRSVVAAGGQIACEVCGFDFGATYGDVGRGYIEVHHVRPLHDSGPVLTRLEDLALLCSNCHRMIHRSRPWLNPSELAERLER
ncbi:HNH endonuclease [Micrococcus sp. HOU01]|uniref:HNH endonuclease n=1 Tax=Micrococcus sp. HOU01 TaxID=3101753 RepID=UPI002D796096|nr:HNH endonuclease [Micrococcus sp. HOU1]WRQ42654.1 HNH endonuclease [Micrococcus sp. HOU1]